MGKSDPFRFYQPKERPGVVSTRVNLLCTKHGKQVGHPPGVNMEHRSQRHVNISRIHGGITAIGAEGGHKTIGVQHNLAVAETDTFWQAGRAGGIKNCGGRIFIEIRENIFRVSL